MAKRTADNQINKDRLEDGSDSEGPAVAEVASAEILAKRKILKPKGRSFTPNSRPSSSGFSSIGSLPTSQNSESSEKLKALANKFLEAVNKFSVSAGVPDFRGACEKYLEYYRKIEDGSFGGAGQSTNLESGQSTGNSFGFGSVPNFPVESLPKKSEGESATKFASAAASQSKSNPFSGINFGLLTAHNSQPDTPKNPFAGVSFTKPQADSKPTETGSATQPEAVTVSSDSESEEEKPKELESAGPSFNLSAKPTIKDSPFSFNKPPQKKEDDSDSDSKIEIKGPTFSFNNKILDPVFSLKKTEDAPKLLEASNSNAQSPSSTFDFNPQTSVSVESNASTSKPPEQPSSGFNFSAQAFGSSTGSTLETNKPAPFFFGSTSTANNAKKAHSFLFTADNTTSTTPYSSEAAFSAESKDPALSAEVKPVFLSGFTSLATESKSGFLSGTASSEAKPAFLFGSSTLTVAKPAFLFGSTKSDSKQALFLFGNGAPSSKTEPAPFSFGSTAPPSFSFGSAPAATAAAPSYAENEDSKEIEVEADIQFAPVASLGDKQIDISSGEENEDVKSQLRVKLMLFDASNTAEPYKNMGVGDLKILKSKDESSSRALFRADGTLRVLLNAALKKEINYKTMGNGSLVRVPVIEVGGKITTYVLKVKTAEEGQNLAKTLNETKC